MREAVTRGVVCVEDPETMLVYHVAGIDYTEREDGSFLYSIRPRYAVIGLLSPPLFQGIPGVNLDLRREAYERRDRTPVFVSERAPAENREDLWELLDAEGMGYLNKLEWLIRTETRYPGDGLFVRRAPGDGEAGLLALDWGEAGARSAQAMRTLLEAICAGRDVAGEGFSIGDANRAEAHALLRPLYLKERRYLEERRREGAEGARRRGRLGRPRKGVDQIALIDAMERYSRGEMGLGEALDRAGVSRATFFRRMREFGLGRRGAAGP